MSKQTFQTNPAQPSHFLITPICYPNNFNFTDAAAEHGCKHEKKNHLTLNAKTLDAYEPRMKEMYVNFKVKGCWHFINQQCPWLHATPDFLCSCDCCDEGCCEVKCPDCTKYLSFKEYFTKQESCLNTEMTIKDTIQYFLLTIPHKAFFSDNLQF